ncbi:unnamed protein product [Pleuronectes platessa]|uniref:Uncharacterized protein n=1 Tax=Pleuronectes platessa TaxID=8262 RepID=A0A9N7THC7_PLEPL|nr:unnamed protein product [Pleuronectes platessa]
MEREKKKERDAVKDSDNERISGRRDDASRGCGRVGGTEERGGGEERRGKALMISGSHEICTACRSRLPRFTEPRLESSSPSLPSFLTAVPSYYLFSPPPKPPRLSLSIAGISLSPRSPLATFTPLSLPPPSLPLSLSHYPFLILFRYDTHCYPMDSSSLCQTGKK